MGQPFVKLLLRPLPITFCLLIGLLFTVILSLCQGTIPMSLTQLGQAFLRQGDPLYQTVIWELRLPRILAALVVGAALGMSGALLQGMLRNGLADPFVLGISSGAGLVATLMFAVGGLQSWIPVAAWVGAMLTAAIVYLLGFTRTGLAIERLLLAGIAVSSLLGAFQAVLLLMTEEGRVQSVLNWLVGSLNGRGWSEVWMVAPYVAIALLGGCLLARTLNVMNLGDEMATGLGISLGRSRLLIGAIASLLAASAVSISGLIGFVGLVVPHGIRLLIGNDYRWVLPLSALGGAWVLTFSDWLARIGAIELPVGAVTAILGSPLFILLIYRRRQ